MRVKIVDIHETDCWYHQRDRLIGRVGEFKKSNENAPGHWGGNFTLEKAIRPPLPNGDDKEFYFLAMKFRKIRACKKK